MKFFRNYPELGFSPIYDELDCFPCTCEHCKKTFNRSEATLQNVDDSIHDEHHLKLLCVCGYATTLFYQNMKRIRELVRF